MAWILSTLKIKQNGFCPKKGFCPSWKTYGRYSVHLVKMSGRDYVREGFCPTLVITIKTIWSCY